MQQHRCYFQSTVDGKVSKCEAIFRPPQTEKRACRRYFSSVWMKIYVLQALFSVPRDGRLSKREAGDYMTYFSMDV